MSPTDTDRLDPQSADGAMQQRISQLCSAIETALQHPMRTPKDFDYLQLCIEEQLHEHISTSTLKRLWGYLPGYASPRTSTLDILARFLEEIAPQAPEVPLAPEVPKAPSAPLAPEVPSAPSSPKRHLGVAFFLTALLALLLVSVAGAYLFFHRTSDSTTATTSTCIIHRGQRFATPQDYLRLFGIHHPKYPWGCEVPHHPTLSVWGPTYHHPVWHNDGDSARFMPTITERYAPEGGSADVVNMANRDQYWNFARLNEVRITFMKNLVDTGYVFLGAYRLALAQSDTTRLVWERVADDCDLAHLEYLEQLRN